MKSVWAARLPTSMTAFSAAAAAVATLAQFCLGWLAVCGVSTPSVLGLCIGLAVGFCLASKISATSQRLIFAVAVGLLSFMTAVILDTALVWGVFATESVGVSSDFAFCVVGVFAAGFAWILTSWLLSSAPTSSVPSVCFGAAVGCFVPLLNSIGVFPLWIAPMALLVAATLLSMKVSTPAEAKPDSTSVNSAAVISILGFGLFCHASVRMMGLLTPNNAVLLLLSSGVFLVFATILSTGVLDRLLQHPVLKFPVMAAVVMLPAGFGFLVETNLTWNSSVDSVLSISLFRAFQLASMFAVSVLALRIVSQSERSNESVAPVLQAQDLSAFVVGMCAGVVVTALGLNAAFEALLGSALLLTPALMHRKLNPVFATGTAICGLLVAVSVNVDSASTSQTLFSARAANALRLGLTMDVVDQSHCTRLIRQVTGESGQLTIWKTSAEMVEVRRDGIPAGLISTNELTTPQFLPEILTAVLPLVMHPNPQHVLVLGDDVGMCTRVCCSFPLPSIEVSRSDRATTQFATDYVWNQLATSPVDDNRVTIRQESIAAASRRSRSAANRLDVVISASPNPVSMLCQEQLTTQFYTNLKEQLSAEGVFCQRITQHDLGPEPIHRILSSLTSVFGRVVVFQVAPGEMAMVAGVAEDSLLDSQLLDRLQRSHVIRELGRCGWDWSQVAALPVVDTNDPVGVFEHNPAVRAVSADSGFFALSLPLESARWGNKPNEVRTMFAPHQLRMADAAPHGNSYPEYARRYSSVIQQMEILSTFHDEPFAYRNSLKSEMQRNPRPAIEKIRNGKITQEADPRDEYRKHYFVSLGNVLRQAADGFADPLALRELTGFTSRYEPLMSFFAHHELIRIHEAAAHPGPARELQHRLHTIFFADGRDFSVRQITAAMDQIVRNPELLPTDEARFDHLNAMLQELVRRWEGRRDHTPKSARRTQADVDSCVKVANQALDMMEKMSETVSMPRHKFLARRKFINKALVAPLRTYGEQVLAHRMKTEPPLESMDLLIDDPDLPLLATPTSDLTN